MSWQGILRGHAQPDPVTGRGAQGAEALADGLHLQPIGREEQHPWGTGLTTVGTESVGDRLKGCGNAVEKPATGLGEGNDLEGQARVSGSLWGRISWGIFWTWDSRLTTTAFLFVTYIGYLAVRGLGGTHQQRARRSAIIALLATLEVPLVHFSVKWWRPLHQQESVAEGKLDGLMLFTLFVGIIAFTLLYVWLVLHRQRVLAMEDALDDQGLDVALAERRAEGAQV